MRAETGRACPASPGWSTAGGSRILGAGRSYMGKGMSEHGMPGQMCVAEASSVQSTPMMNLGQVSGAQGQWLSTSPSAEQRLPGRGPQ